MKKQFRIIGLVMLFAVISKASFGRTATNAEKWADYAAGDFDITPHIVYARANNTDLKFDLYLPKNRVAPIPTLLFHGRFNPAAVD